VITNKEADKVLTAVEQESARREAEIKLAEAVSNDESAWYAFMQVHVGHAAIYSDGTGLPNLSNLCWDNMANKTLLMDHCRRSYPEGVTPGTLEKAFVARKNDLAPIPKTANPKYKSGERVAENGNEKNIFVAQQSKAVHEFKNKEMPIPYTRYQLLEMSGQVKGKPGNLEAFRRLVRQYGSQKINRVILS